MSHRIDSGPENSTVFHLLVSYSVVFPSLCDFHILWLASLICLQNETRAPAPVPSFADSALGDNSIMSGLQALHILPLWPLVRGKPRQDEIHIPSCPCLPRKRNLKPVAAE